MAECIISCLVVCFWEQNRRSCRYTTNSTPIQVLSVSAIFLDSIFGENGFQLFQPHVEFLFREAGLAVCKEAESIGIVFLGEHPSLLCQLVEYFLGVCGERGGRGSGRSTGREGGRGGGWVKREEVSGERMS